MSGSSGSSAGWAPNPTDMNWPTIETSLLHPGAGYTIGAAFLLTVFLLRFSKVERRSVLRTVGIFALCLVCVWVSHLLEDLFPDFPVDYVRGTAIFGEGLCLISLSLTAIFRVLMARLGLQATRIVQDVSVTLLSIVWLFAWLHSYRVNLASIVTTSAVVTAVLGLSLQDTIGNILGGIAIQFDQSIQVGDWVKIDDVTGQVVEVRWRHTSVETRDWETVVIPNSVLLKSKFQVLGRRRGMPLQWRRTLPFAVDMHQPPPRVIEVAQTAIQEAEIPNVAADPAPYCVFWDCSDGSGRYLLRYWLTDLLRDHATDSDVRTHLFFALQRAGIPLHIPMQEVFVAHRDPVAHEARNGDSSTDRLAALRRVDVLGSLSEDEISHLAARLIPAPFAQGAVVTRQGTQAKWLYIITEGQVDVIVEDADGNSAKVAELGAGNFFGEMGLMTGEPRSATVVARNHVHCYRLDKDSFHEILRERPNLAEEISDLLAQRRAGLDAVLRSLDEESQMRHFRRSRNDLLKSIRTFFGLED